MDSASMMFVIRLIAAAASTKIVSPSDGVAILQVADASRLVG
jgi:hypothetical protein